MVWDETTWPKLEVCVLIVGVVFVTSTVWLAAPTAILKLRLSRSWTLRTMPLWVCISKPDAATVTE